MAYPMCVDKCEVGSRVSEVVEGMWLGTELLVWTAKQRLTGLTGMQFQVCVFKAGVDLNTPSDITQLMMPNKELLWLEVLHAAKESWLQALHAAGLASCAQHDAAKAACLQAECDAVAQASKQALLSDLWSTGSAVYMWQLQHAAAEVQCSHSRLLE